MGYCKAGNRECPELDIEIGRNMHVTSRAQRVRQVEDDCAAGFALVVPDEADTVLCGLQAAVSVDVEESIEREIDEVEVFDVYNIGANGEPQDA